MLIRLSEILSVLDNERLPIEAQKINDKLSLPQAQKLLHELVLIQTKQGNSMVTPAEPNTLVELNNTGFSVAIDETVTFRFRPREDIDTYLHGILGDEDDSSLDDVTLSSVIVNRMTNEKFKGGGFNRLTSPVSQYHCNLETKVFNAVKEIDPFLLRRPNDTELLLEPADNIKNIIYKLYETTNVDWLSFDGGKRMGNAVPLIPGRNLEQLIKMQARNKAKDPRVTPWFICQMFIQLAQLHAAGYVHKDLKPDNLMLDNNGKVWMIDHDSMARYISNATGKNGDVNNKCDLTGGYFYVPFSFISLPDRNTLSFPQNEVSPQQDVYAMAFTAMRLCNFQLERYSKEHGTIFAASLELAKNLFIQYAKTYARAKTEIIVTKEILANLDNLWSDGLNAVQKAQKEIEPILLQYKNTSLLKENAFLKPIASALSKEMSAVNVISNMLINDKNLREQAIKSLPENAANLLKQYNDLYFSVKHNDIFPEARDKFIDYLTNCLVFENTFSVDTLEEKVGNLAPSMQAIACKQFKPLTIEYLRDADDMACKEIFDEVLSESSDVLAAYQNCRKYSQTQKMITIFDHIVTAYNNNTVISPDAVLEAVRPKGLLSRSNSGNMAINGNPSSPRNMSSPRGIASPRAIASPRGIVSSRGIAIQQDNLPPIETNSAVNDQLLADNKSSNKSTFFRPPSPDVTPQKGAPNLEMLVSKSVIKSNDIASTDTPERNKNSTVRVMS